MASSPDKNELNMHGSDDGSVSPDSPKNVLSK